MKLLTLLPLCLLTLAQAANDTHPELPLQSDWPRFQGPRGNGTTPEVGWNTHWPADGPPVLWQAELGQGLAAFAIVGSHVFTAGNNGADQASLASPYLISLHPAGSGRNGSSSWPCIRHEAIESALKLLPRIRPGIESGNDVA